MNRTCSRCSGADPSVWCRTTNGKVVCLGCVRAQPEGEETYEELYAMNRVPPPDMLHGLEVVR